MKKLKNIIILAGGESSRFWPLTHKNLFLFCGKPLIIHQIEKYASWAEHLFVVAHRATAETIQHAVTSDSISIIVQQGEGQAAALLSIGGNIEGEALIVNGNDLFENSLFEILFQKTDISGVDGVFAALKLKKYFPGGILKHEEDRVLEVLEKPGKDNMPSHLLKMVVDYYKNFEDFRKTLRSSQTTKDDLYEVAVSDYIRGGRDIRYVVYEGEWATIKYPWHVLDVMNFFLRDIKSYRGKNVVVHPTAVLSGEVYLDDDVKVYEYARIVGPAYIGKNSIVGTFALVTGSIIGANSVVGGYCEVARSYLGENVWLHRNYVGDSVLQDNILFGAGAVTANFRFDAKSITSTIKGEKVDTQMKKMGAIIGSDVKVGVNASIMPGVKIGAGVRIMPGEVVRKDIASFEI